MIDSLLYRFLGDSSSFDDAVDKVQTGLNSAAVKAGLAGAAITAMFTATAISAVWAAGEYEKQQIAFETLLGSASEAEALFSRLTDFAAKTPFEMPEILAATRGLVQFGERGDQLMSTLNMLGNASAATGTNFGDLALIFNQVRGVGKLLTQDFRQMSTRGIISLQDIADHYGTTTEAANKMLSSGKISFEDLRTILENLSKEGGRFAGLMEKQSTSFLGLWSTITDAVGIEIRKIGQQMLPLGKSILQVITWVLGAIGAMPDSMRKVVAGVIVLGAASGLLLTTLSAMVLVGGQLVIAYGSLSAMFTATGAAAAGASLGVTALNLAISLSVVGLVAFGIALAAAGIYWLAYGRYASQVTKDIQKSEAAHKSLMEIKKQGFSKEMQSIETTSANRMEAAQRVQSEIDLAQKNLDGLARNAQQASKNLSAATAGGDNIEIQVKTHELKMANDMVGLGIEQLKELQKRADELKLGPKDGPVSEEVLASTQAYIDSLKAKLKVMGLTEDQIKLNELAEQKVGPTLLAQAKAAQDAIKTKQAVIDKKKEEQQAIDDLSEDYKNYMDRLHEVQATMGMTSDEVEVYRMRLRGLTDAQAKAALAASEQVKGEQAKADAQKKADEERKAAAERMKSDAQALKDSMKSPFENAIESARKYNDMLRRGLITKQEMGMALRKLAKDLEGIGGLAARKFYVDMLRKGIINQDQFNQKIREMADEVYKVSNSRFNETRDFDISMAGLSFMAPSITAPKAAGAQPNGQNKMMQPTNTLLQTLINVTQQKQPVVFRKVNSVGTVI